MTRIMLALTASLLLAVVPPIARAAEPPSVNSHGATEHESFTLKAQSDMQNWTIRIHDFAVAAEDSGRHVDSHAEDDLTGAWRRARAASAALQGCGADGWPMAKSAYEAAARDLGTAWNKLHREAVCVAVRELSSPFQGDPAVVWSVAPAC